MALNGLFCADVPLRNYSLTNSLTACIGLHCQQAQTKIQEFHINKKQKEKTKGNKTQSNE